MKSVAFAVLSFTLILSPVPSRTAPNCPVFNFKTLFFADFSAGSIWDTSQGERSITWSAKATTIYDEATVRPFTKSELSWIRTAFQSWDEALATISFREVHANQSPEIVIGFVALKPSSIQLDAMSFWNTWSKDNKRYKATIKVSAADRQWFSVKNQFTHTIQHEIGNVLGLGDIKPSKSFVSVLEDPWQPPYGKPKLSTTDVAMIRQLYGESNCKS